MKTILSVSQLNAQCKKTLETSFPRIWVDGEISNLIRAGSGHWYFTLKDSQSQIRCAMFKFKNSVIRFIPENGMQVTLAAKITLYEPRGDYQLICEHMELSGDGKILREFELLKQKLTQQGLFDIQFKKPLPKFPKTIGIISSADGAAVHDILHVLKRRAPSVKVILYPSLVQGSSAVEQLRQALHDAQQAIETIDQQFNQANSLSQKPQSLSSQAESLQPEKSLKPEESLQPKSPQLAKSPCDVLIIARGGGSLEDLNAFNDEQLALDIFSCSIPIVSAVGHEIDFTICDFVADVRAPTPSAAAEIVSQDENQWIQWLEQINIRLVDLITKHIKHKNNELSWLSKQLKHPGNKLETIRQKLDELSFRQNQAIIRIINNHKQRLELQILQLKHYHPQHQLKQNKDNLNKLYQHLEKIIAQILAQKQNKLSTTMQKLDVLSPLSIMSRGYALVSSVEYNKQTKMEKLKLIKSKQELSANDIVKIRFVKDHIYAKIID